MKAEVLRAEELAPGAEHTICIQVKLVAESEKDEEIIDSIGQIQEDKEWLPELGVYATSLDGKEFEFELLF